MMFIIGGREYFLVIFICTFNVENYLSNLRFIINSYDVSCLSKLWKKVVLLFKIAVASGEKNGWDYERKLNPI